MCRRQHLIRELCFKRRVRDLRDTAPLFGLTSPEVVVGSGTRSHTAICDFQNLCVRMCVCAYVYAHVYVCMCVCTCVYVCVCMHACVCVTAAQTRPTGLTQPKLRRNLNPSKSEPSPKPLNHAGKSRKDKPLNHV